MAVDMEKLQEFLGRFVTDLGATFAAGNVVIGHHLPAPAWAGTSTTRTSSPAASSSSAPATSPT